MRGADGVVVSISACHAGGLGHGRHGIYLFLWLLYSIRYVFYINIYFIS